MKPVALHQGATSGLCTLTPHDIRLLTPADVASIIEYWKKDILVYIPGSEASDLDVYEIDCVTMNGPIFPQINLQREPCP